MNKMLIIAGAAGAAMSIVGCSGSAYAIVGPSVPEKTVEQKAGDALSPKVGALVTVDCLQPLPAKIGETISCKITSPGGEGYAVKTTAKDVKGDKVNMGFEIVRAP